MIAHSAPRRSRKLGLRENATSAVPVSPGMPATLEKFRLLTTEAVDMEALFQARDLVIARWRCRVREAGMSASLCHRWHIIKFVHTGAFQAHLSEGTVHVDSTRTLLAAPRNAYRVTRQFGPAVTGSAIALGPTVMQ